MEKSSDTPLNLNGPQGTAEAQANISRRAFFDPAKAIENAKAQSQSDFKTQREQQVLNSVMEPLRLKDESEFAQMLRDAEEIRKLITEPGSQIRESLGDVFRPLAEKVLSSQNHSDNELTMAFMLCTLDMAKKISESINFRSAGNFKPDTSAGAAMGAPWNERVRVSLQRKFLESEGSKEFYVVMRWTFGKEKVNGRWQRRAFNLGKQGIDHYLVREYRVDRNNNLVEFSRPHQELSPVPSFEVDTAALPNLSQNALAPLARKIYLNADTHNPEPITYPPADIPGYSDPAVRSTLVNGSYYFADYNGQPVSLANEPVKVAYTNGSILFFDGNNRSLDLAGGIQTGYFFRYSDGTIYSRSNIKPLYTSIQQIDTAFTPICATSNPIGGDAPKPSTLGVMTIDPTEERYGFNASPFTQGEFDTQIYDCVTGELVPMYGHLQRVLIKRKSEAWKKLLKMGQPTGGPDEQRPGFNAAGNFNLRSYSGEGLFRPVSFFKSGAVGGEKLYDVPFFLPEITKDFIEAGILDLKSTSAQVHMDRASNEAFKRYGRDEKVPVGVGGIKFPLDLQDLGSLIPFLGNKKSLPFGGEKFTWGDKSDFAIRAGIFIATLIGSPSNIFFNLKKGSTESFMADMALATFANGSFYNSIKAMLGFIKRNNAPFDTPALSTTMGILLPVVDQGKAAGGIGVTMYSQMLVSREGGGAAIAFSESWMDIASGIASLMALAAWRYSNEHPEFKEPGMAMLHFNKHEDFVSAVSKNNESVKTLMVNKAYTIEQDIAKTKSGNQAKTIIESLIRSDAFGDERWNKLPDALALRKYFREKHKDFDVFSATLQDKRVRSAQVTSPNTLLIDTTPDITNPKEKIVYRIVGSQGLASLEKVNMDAFTIDVSTKNDLRVENWISDMEKKIGPGWPIVQLAIRGAYDDNNLNMTDAAVKELSVLGLTGKDANGKELPLQFPEDPKQFQEELKAVVRNMYLGSSLTTDVLDASFSKTGFKELKNMNLGEALVFLGLLGNFKLFLKKHALRNNEIEAYKRSVESNDKKVQNEGKDKSPRRWFRLGK